MENTNVLELLLSQHTSDRQKCSRFMKDILGDNDKKNVKEDIIAFWNHDLQKHVEAEERILIPFLVKHRFNYEFINVLKREHDTIRVLAGRLRLHEDGFHTYKAFIKLVDQHTYFEYEIVFPKMREDIPVQELMQLDRSMLQVA